MERPIGTEDRVVPRALRYTHQPVRAIFTCAGLVVLACIALATGVAGGASSNLIVDVDVPSSTTLITSTCAPNTAGVTNFGIVTPGSTVMTSDDCAVTFGSTNDSTSLRMTQSDGTGTAMGTPNDLWTRQAGASSTTYSETRVASNFVWVLRSTGGLNRSADSGATFPLSLSSLSNNSGNHASLSIPTTSVGWMTGDGTGEVWRSTNANLGAPTWNVTTANPGFTTRGVHGLDATTAWVVGDNGDIARSNGGGTSWTAFTWTDAPGNASALADDLSGIEGIPGDANSFIAFGSGGRVLVTSDAATWRDASMGGGWNIADAELIDDDHAVIIASGGAIATSSNLTAGTPTWTTRSISMPIDLKEVEFMDPDNGMIVGEEGTMLRTSDGGATWTLEDADTSLELRGLAWVTGSTWVASGTGQNIIRTTDGGPTWTYSADQFDTWEDVSMTTERTGWRVGHDGLIGRTTNGGTSWTAQTSNTPNDLFSVRAISTQRAIAVGRNGTIVTTSDGGTTWVPRASNVTANLMAVDTWDSNAWAAGYGGTILRSTDDGATWTTSHTSAGDQLRDIESLSATTIMAIGAAGEAFRSTDFGATWSNPALPSGGSHADLITSLPGVGTAYYVAGSHLWASTDLGANWVDRGATPVEFNALDMVNATHLFAAAGGTVRRSVDGGAIWTTMPSAANFSSHSARGIDMLDRTTGIAVGNGNLTGITGFTGTVANYVENTSDWIGHGTEAFGVCLRSTTATPTWTPNATCDQSADGPHWNAVPTVTDSTAEVATTAIGDGNRVANFRFGLRVDPSEPPGELSAGITFVLISPDV